DRLDLENLFFESEKTPSLKVGVGFALTNGDNRQGKGRVQVTEGLAVKLIDRANALRASQPAAARLILSNVENLPLPVVEVHLVERIGAGWADIAVLTRALEGRDSIRKSAGDELYDLIKQGGYAAGVAAAILNDERERIETLTGPDTKA